MTKRRVLLNGNPAYKRFCKDVPSEGQVLELLKETRDLVKKKK